MNKNSKYLPIKRISTKLKDKIFDYITGHINEDLDTKDIYVYFKDDFDKILIKEEDKISCIKTIKQWKYRPPKRYQTRYMAENKNLLDKQQKQIVYNNNIIREQKQTLQEKKKKNKTLDTNIIVKKAKLEGYEQAMFLQKRVMYILEKIKCKINNDLSVNIDLDSVDKNEKATLFDATIILMVARIFNDMKSSNKATETAELLFNILKENEKAISLFMQQNNSFNQSIENEQTPQPSLAEILKNCQNAK